MASLQDYIDNTTNDIKAFFNTKKLITKPKIQSTTKPSTHDDIQERINEIRKRF